jgi:hypothetical protein
MEDRYGGLHPGARLVRGGDGVVRLAGRKDANEEERGGVGGGNGKEGSRGVVVEMEAEVAEERVDALSRTVAKRRKGQ